MSLVQKVKTANLVAQVLLTIAIPLTADSTIKKGYQENFLVSLFMSIFRKSKT